MVQTFLAVGQENRGSYSHDVPVPSDIATTSFQRIPIAYNHQSSSSSFSSHPDAVTLAIQARQRVELDDNTYRTPSTFAANPLVQVKQARQEYDRQGADEANDRSSSVSSIMMQVMEARKRAGQEEEDSAYGRLAVTESSGGPSSSGLIQAMLARQQAQNEYDDGY